LHRSEGSEDQSDAPTPLVFSELLILAGVKQLFLASFNGGAARTRVQRRMTSTAKITMAISRNTTDLSEELSSPKKKRMTARVLAAMAARRRGVLKRWVVFGRPFTGVQKQRAELSLRFCR